MLFGLLPKYRSCRIFTSLSLGIVCLVTSVWHSVCRLIAVRAFIDKENNYKPHRGELDPVRSPIDPSNLLGAIWLPVPGV